MDLPPTIRLEFGKMTEGHTIKLSDGATILVSEGVLLQRDTRWQYALRQLIAARGRKIYGKRRDGELSGEAKK